MTNTENGAEKKPWQIPWSNEQIKANANNWSLAGDAGVCFYD